MLISCHSIQLLLALPILLWHISAVQADQSLLDGSAQTDSEQMSIEQDNGETGHQQEDEETTMAPAKSSDSSSRRVEEEVRQAMRESRTKQREQFAARWAADFVPSGMVEGGHGANDAGTEKTAPESPPPGVDFPKARALASGRYEAPAQRPDLLPQLPAYDQQQQPYSAPSPQPPPPQNYAPPPAPRVSFRSPNGQYAPLWAPAGAAFAVPASAPATGIAYYAPQTGGQGGEEYGGAPTPKRPPVLLIGNFPPSATVRPSNVGYQIQATPGPFVTRYQPPNPPQVPQFGTSPFPPYGQEFPGGQVPPQFPSPPSSQFPPRLGVPPPSQQQQVPPSQPGYEQPPEFPGKPTPPGQQVPGQTPPPPGVPTGPTPPPQVPGGTLPPGVLTPGRPGERFTPAPTRPGEQPPGPPEVPSLPPGIPPVSPRFPPGERVPGQEVPGTSPPPGVPPPGQQVPGFTPPVPTPPIPGRQPVETPRPPTFVPGQQHVPGQQAPPPGQFIPGRPFGATPAFPTLVPGQSTPRPEFTTPQPTPGLPGQEFPAPPGPTVPIPPQQPPQSTPSPQETVPNRVVGKARVICLETGVDFGVRTILPFTGQIFAYDRKRVPSCVHTFHNEVNINISFSFAECGIRNQPASTGQSSQMEQFHLQIVVMFEQPNGSSSVQSYFAQCGQNKVRYEKQPPIPRRIEEALEELRIVPGELEQKAPIPVPQMRVLTEVEHHKEGDGLDVGAEVTMGQPLRVEFSLQPETDAYGFLVRNCVVRDALSGKEHEVVDHRGCSTDLNIFGHPHYDTYHDVARVHWHAFKLPDQSRLALSCRVDICTDLKDRQDGPSSCAAIPTPPFCADLVTSAADSVLADLPSSRVRRDAEGWEQRVRAAVCLGNSSRPCAGGRPRQGRDQAQTGTGDGPQAAPPLPCAALSPSLAASALSLSLLLVSAFGNALCRCLRRHGKQMAQK